MSGYIGWLHREEHRELRQVERELYPSVREMEQERKKPTSPRRRTFSELLATFTDLMRAREAEFVLQAEPTAPSQEESAIGSDRKKAIA